ncbi:MAG: protease [Flavobacteriales bacterium]|nr:protease [Flavobacteriales bacterium]|tara:strand:- start:51 stop:617 length:567 start_codon:yes stop_codon:yes gene_type:complete
MIDQDDKKVAILATDGFEESELIEPMLALQNAGIQCHVVSTDTERNSIKSWKDGNWGKDIKVDKHLRNIKHDDYNALMLPGGVINPDKLRREDEAVNFVRDFFAAHKPVAAICHGPQILIEADVVDGRKLTSFHSIKKDLKNAGANWVDEEVVVDQGLVSSRNPNDLPAFNSKLIEEVMEGKHAEQTV